MRKAREAKAAKSLENSLFHDSDWNGELIYGSPNKRFNYIANKWRRKQKKIQALPKNPAGPVTRQDSEVRHRQEAKLNSYLLWKEDSLKGHSQLPIITQSQIYINDPQFRSSGAQKYLNPHQHFTSRQLKFIEAANIQFKCKCAVCKSHKILLKASQLSETKNIPNIIDLEYVRKNNIKLKDNKIDILNKYNEKLKEGPTKNQNCKCQKGMCDCNEKNQKCDCDFGKCECNKLFI